MQGSREALVGSVVVIPIGLVAGTAGAYFLWALDGVTPMRGEQGWLIYGLPFAGMGIVWLYQRWGQSVEAGNKLLLEQILQTDDEAKAGPRGVPLRMAPLVLLTTLISHLFGASVGREGTAVQMGGSLASGYGRLWRTEVLPHPVFLRTGIAAGFGAVFGTPWAGAIFALEVIIVGRVRWRYVPPILVAAWIGHLTCLAWGAPHTTYGIATVETAGRVATVDFGLVGQVLLAAAAFGMASRLFVMTTDGLRLGLTRIAPSGFVRAAVGGVLTVCLVHLVGSRDYLGLGVTGLTEESVSILTAFETGGAETWSWAWKLLFTSVALAAGFKGGEVTPLFFIGATLGHTLAVTLGAPIDLFAGLGFVAVFAAATKTPLACTVMAMELFGPHYALVFALACFVADACAGPVGIYGNPHKRL